MLGQPKLPRVQTSSAELEGHIEAAVLEQVTRGRINLPAMPRVAARAFTLLRRRDFSVAEVAALIETDPVVAARLVHLANSVAFATACRLQSVQACVSRLGARELSFFLMDTAAKQLIECHDPRIAHFCDGLWEHSLVVAILSHDLAEALPGTDAEAAYLAGLLHDIGRPVVAEMLLDAEKRLLGKSVDHWILPSKWLAIIMRCEREVGLAVTRSWLLPESVSDAVVGCADYDQERPFRLANVVRLANALARASGHDVAAGSADAETCAQEGSKILDLEPDVVAGVMAALPARLAGRMA